MADIQYTPESRKLHADMMLRIAEKIILAIATGLVGVPFALLLAKESTDTIKLYLLVLTGLCLIPACLVRNAMSHYRKLKSTNTNNAIQPQPNEPAPNGIDHIQIQHGNTHISINIQPETNNA